MQDHCLVDMCNALSGQGALYWVGQSDSNSWATFSPESVPGSVSNQVVVSVRGGQPDPLIAENTNPAPTAVIQFLRIPYPSATLPRFLN